MDVKDDLKRLRTLERTIAHKKKLTDKLVRRKDDVSKMPDSDYKCEVLNEISEAIKATGIEEHIHEVSILEKTYIEKFNLLPDDIQKIMIERFIFTERIEDIALREFWSAKTVMRKIKEGIKILEDSKDEMS